MDRRGGQRPDDDALSLADAALRLGVHYMTAYRYVRLGRLPASQRDGRWWVRAQDLERLAAPGAPGRRSGPPRWAVARRRLAQRLLAGDTAACWSLVEQALAGGASATDVYLELLGPALTDIGDRWATGAVTVHAEHRATAVAVRVAGRLGARFSRRGTPLAGTVVLGGAPGDPHLLPVVMVADVLRHHRLRVLDLGANVPLDSFLQVTGTVGDLQAVGVSVSDGGRTRAAAEVLTAVRAARPGVLLLAGGPAVGSRDEALALGADDWAPDGRTAATLLGGRE